ncbi:MAG: DUF1254 domain-containing protein [Akkermansiaceae bacterium]|nr:DUF1254 domain-containing protein [Akkermansiaceae bacterium]
MKPQRLLSLAAALLPVSGLAQDGGRSIETRVGTLTFDERGMPTEETSDLLFSWLDFQYGVQSFLWGLPYVGAQGWLESNRFHGATGETDMVAYGGYEGSMGILTPTSNVTYVFGFPNLEKTGPVVWDIPPGAIIGSIMDFSQRAQGDFGLPGPDKGEGVKLLITGPGQETPKGADGYRVIQLPTATAMMGLRILNPDEVKDLSSKLKLYPFSKRDNPPASKLIFAGEKNSFMAQPHGMAYWERLNTVIQREPVEERDRFFMAMLRSLGIEKGKAFQPDEHQAKVLEAAAIVGEKMAMANSFDHFKRGEAARYRDDSHWKYVLEPEVPSQRGESYDALEERAAYTYEAIATSFAMVTKTPGVGSGYIGMYRDHDGDWLDGGKNYHLHVPPNPPAKRFWSITLYDTGTRSFVPNETKVAEIGSRTKGLKQNDDGSVDLWFGPKAPAGKESNWVQTSPGKAWFTYLRCYGPLEGFLEATWPVPDIEKAK